MQSGESTLQSAYRRVAVFVGSRMGNDPLYAETVHEAGTLLGGRPCEIIFGGGHFGLMKIFGDAAAEAGEAHITAVIPERLAKGRVMSIINRLIPVGGIFGRKRELILGADVAFALPGGIGTGDETLGVIAYNDLSGYLSPGKPLKPLIVVNINGCFDWLEQHIATAIRQGFADERVRQNIHWAQSAREAIEIYERLGGIKIPSGSQDGMRCAI